MTDPAKFEAVLALIESGRSERAACEEVGLPRGTFRSGVIRVASGVHYARACEALARDQVEQLEAVMEDARSGALPVDVARLEADTRKWIASKLFRPTWGDKVALVGGTPGQDEPVQVVSDLDRAKAVAALVAKAKKG